MNLDLTAISTNALIAVPICIAIVQAIKLTGWLPDHFSPLASIGVGIIVGWLGGDHTSLNHSILVGAIYGLMGSGLYSGVKVTMQAHQQMQQEQQKKKEQREQKKAEREAYKPYPDDKC
jgi:hypothetical protein